MRSDGDGISKTPGERHMGRHVLGENWAHAQQPITESHRKMVTAELS